MNDGRIAKLSAELKKQGMDAFIAQAPSTLGYLTDWPEDSHERFMAFVVTKSGESALICPALSAVQAARAGIKDIRPWRDGEDPQQLFFDLADAWDLRKGILAVDDTMPAKQLLDMQAIVPSALYKPGSPVIGEVMRSKDDQELDWMKAAAAIADAAFDSVLPQIRAGLSEIELGELLATEMKSRGGKPEFVIVAVGPNSAEPHHLNDETVITPDSVVLMDFGCSVEGYCSDITRTVCFGAATQEMKDVYKAVFEAHQAARQNAKPGATGAEVDAGARNSLVAAGYGEFFTHRTGHGIGSQIHEAPYISNANHEPLKPGDCFSIEPGVYLTGNFGIRIENIVTLTEEGLVSLNAEPSPTIIEV